MLHRSLPAISGILGMCVGILASVGLFTFHYAQGTSYLHDNPEVCANCHIMQRHYDSWLKGSHKAVAVCNDCHIPHGLLAKYIAKARNGFHHSKAFTTGNFHDPIMITSGNRMITEAACRSCHQDIVHMIDHDRGHRDNDLSCIRCHRDVGHR